MSRSYHRNLSKTAATTSASLLLGALGFASLLSTAYAGPVAQPPGSEKCYGVAKAGKNDCAAGVHSCAGQATRSGDKSSYVYLPSGACAKLVGGSTSPR
jgi:uncharacterized membrane protein